jgi:hypothetical protein
MTFRNLVAVLSVAITLSGCETASGIFSGSTMKGDVTATLSWQSTGSNGGTLTAQVSTGEIYSGHYLQVTSDTRVDELGPLWQGWGWPRNGRGLFWGGWNGWGYWGPSSGFITTYSGRVVANLEGPDRKHMRCRFTLQRPSSGMAGGGMGSCQLPSGVVIDTSIPST